MLKYLKGYTTEAVLAPLFKMIEAFFDLMVPVVMADIINVGVATGIEKYILVRCLVLVLLAGIGYIFSVSAQYFSAKAAVGYTTSLRSQLFRHIESLGVDEFGALGNSTLVTRMTSDTAQVQNGLNIFLRLFLRSPFVVLGSFIMAFSISRSLSLIFAAAIAVLSLVVFVVMKLSMPLYKKTQAGLDELTQSTRENLSGARVVRAFGREDSEAESFTEKNNQLTRSQLFVGRISALLNPISMLVINLAIVALLYSGGIKINAGELRQGDIIALVSYMGQILIELVKMANLIVQVSRALACSSRIKATLSVENKMKFGTAEKLSETPDLAINFKNVSMKYAQAGGESLKNISFSVKAGQTIGIIGGTGSGKSTLVGLIPRLFDVSSGEVEIYDHPISYYSEKAIRRSVGIVTQQPLLFSGTIRTNLMWGNDSAGDLELWRALEIAQAADFVRSKPLGLDEPVEQGGRNLSGGQKQRLTIARAIVKNPKILILDDSSSALDYLTDAALRKAIKNLGNRMTVVIVSQRAAGVMNADLIVVLDNGDAVGMGTHRELIENCTVYKEIYGSQYGNGGGKI